MKLPQNKSGSKDAPMSQCFSFLCLLKRGAVSSVLTQLVSGVELWGSASTGQREGDETRAGVWVSPGSPGAGLTAWLCSAESAEGDVSYRIWGHQHGEPDHPALAR